MASYRNIGTNSKPNWVVEASFGTGLDGKRLRVKKQGFKTKREAEKYISEYSTDINKGNIKLEAREINFGDFLLQWFNDYKSKQLSINTKTNYKSRIETHILPYLGHYKLVKIDNVIVQNFYNTLIGKGLKPATVKKVIEVLNNVFKYANKMRLVSIIPTDIEKLPCETPKIKYWNKDQVDFFLSTIKDSSIYTPILIEIMTGLRIAELCGLRWRDIDLEKGAITVNSQIIFDKINKVAIPTDILKTSTSHRIITIPNILIEHLKAFKEEVKPLEKDFVIKNRYGMIVNPRNLSMNFTKKIEKYSKPLEEHIKETGSCNNYMQLPQISFHGLRHTHATLLISVGENIKVVSERLGHKDINTTLNTYTHVMEEMRNNTASLLNDMFK